MICESKKISLQAQLLDMQTDTHKCIKCDKVSVENQESLKGYEEHNITEESNLAINRSVTKLEDTLKLEKNDSCIIIDPVSKLQPIAFNNVINY